MDTYQPVRGMYPICKGQGDYVLRADHEQALAAEREEFRKALGLADTAPLIKAAEHVRRDLDRNVQRNSDSMYELRRLEQALAAERERHADTEEELRCMCINHGEMLKSSKEWRGKYRASQKDLAAERERADALHDEIEAWKDASGLEREREARDVAKVEAADMIAQLIARTEKAEGELAKLQRWPTLDWAEASRVFVQQLASLARNGEQPAAKRALEAMDGLKAYVTRVENRAEAAKGDVERVRKDRVWWVAQHYILYQKLCRLTSDLASNAWDATLPEDRECFNAQPRKTLPSEELEARLVEAWCERDEPWPAD